MANIFTNVGEFRRGKGNRKTRLGPRIGYDAATRYGEENQIQSPNEIALKKLFKLLDKPGLTVRDRYGYIGLMRQGDQIRFMNMPVLAEVLLYMHNVGNQVNENNFSYTIIKPYLDRLLPQKEILEGGLIQKELSEDELQIMRLRMGATFLRYIRYVSLLQEQATQALGDVNMQQETQLYQEEI